MPSYNSKFDLSIADIDLIEAALQQKRAELSAKVVTKEGVKNSAESEADKTLRHIHDLLGRLHNQKVFYRPRRGAYVGG